MAMQACRQAMPSRGALLGLDTGGTDPDWLRDGGWWWVVAVVTMAMAVVMVMVLAMAATGPVGWPGLFAGYRSGNWSEIIAELRGLHTSKHLRFMN